MTSSMDEYYESRIGRRRVTCTPEPRAYPIAKHLLLLVSREEGLSGLTGESILTEQRVTYAAAQHSSCMIVTLRSACLDGDLDGKICCVLASNSIKSEVACHAQDVLSAQVLWSSRPDLCSSESAVALRTGSTKFFVV